MVSGDERVSENQLKRAKIARFHARSRALPPVKTHARAVGFNPVYRGFIPGVSSNFSQELDSRKASQRRCLAWNCRHGPIQINIAEQQVNVAR